MIPGSFLARLAGRLAPGIVAAFFVASAATAQVASSSHYATMAQRGADAAPITILEFSDFECPFCARMPPVLDELLKKYPDKVRIVFKHAPLPIHPHAPLAHEAALAAGEQGKFWEMHDVLFANQQHLELTDLDRYAADLKLDVARFHKALEGHDFRGWVARDNAEAGALGVTATPTFFINGRRLLGAQPLSTLERTMEELLTGRPSSTTAAAVAPESIDLTGAMFRGVATAPVTIVEFSDLQCPFCARAIPVLDDVLEKYGDKIRLAFKHYPLDIHPNAPFAHRASLAAGEQGKFWAMHDVLFRNQSKATLPGVLEFAGQLGLDMARFQTDLESSRFDARLQRDREEGDRLGVDGTPTFFINGVRLVGARPAGDFAQIIDRQLAAATAATPAYRDAVASRTLGAPDAKVTIVWFGDLRNPLNAEASQLMRQIATTYERSVRIVFKNSPLRNRSESVLMYDAALAAGAQGRFWEMEDLLSGNQSINSLTALAALARELGLDVPRFEANVSDRTFRTVSAADLEDGERQGVRGTPTFFIDDERVDGLVTIDELNSVVERHLRRSGAGQPLER